MIGSFFYHSVPTAAADEGGSDCSQHQDPDKSGIFHISFLPFGFAIGPALTSDLAKARRTIYHKGPNNGKGH